MLVEVNRIGYEIRENLGLFLSRHFPPWLQRVAAPRVLAVLARSTTVWPWLGYYSTVGCRYGGELVRRDPPFVELDTPVQDLRQHVKKGAA